MPLARLASLALSLLAFVAMGATAQTGLRYTPSSERLPWVYDIPLTLVHEAPMTGPTLAYGYLPRLRSWADESPKGSLFNNTVWADWRPWQDNWRTTAGMLWSSPIQSDAGGEDSPTHLLTQRDQSTTPFLGIGWTSNSRRNSWRWSAEVGAFANGDCRSALFTCAAAARPPFSGNNGDGLRWMPYFSLGANFSY